MNTNEMTAPATLHLVLGWSNPGTGGGESMRLYALDGEDDGPRWDNSLGDGGRTAERALIHASPDSRHCEGDRYVLIRIGDRFAGRDPDAALARALADLIPAHHPAPVHADDTDAGDEGVRLTAEDMRDLRAAAKRDEWSGEWNSLPTAVERILSARLKDVR